tara:strand:- start:14 stop:229 length:216 start_codon:yes stop_codon:yes gene_type:complete
MEQKETHIADIFHTKKNLVKDILSSLNLLSSPAFLILKNKKLPSLTAQIIINEARIKFPIIFSELLLKKRT